MNSDTTTTILDKIMKLLAVARNEAATPGEVEAALNRAAHLQREYRLSDEQIGRHVIRDGRGGLNIDARAVVKEVLLTAGRINRWQAWTAAACARAVCAATYTASGYERRIMIYGLPADVAVARELFAFAMDRGVSLQRAWAKAHDLPLSSADAKSWRDGFCRGLYEAAARAVAEARTDTAAAAEAPNTMALVPLTTGAVTVATMRAVAQYRLGLRLGSGRGYRVPGGSGYGAGRAAGAATSLSRGVVR